MARAETLVCLCYYPMIYWLSTLDLTDKPGDQWFITASTRLIRSVMRDFDS